MKSNILVVDDEPVARQSMTDILKLEGHNVMSAPNGQAAVEYVRTHPVDLMIVDLRMPGMDGLEVIQVVNQVSPETEVILLTAFGSTETAIQALKRGSASDKQHYVNQEPANRPFVRTIDVRADYRHPGVAARD